MVERCINKGEVPSNEGKPFHINERKSIRGKSLQMRGTSMRGKSLQMRGNPFISMRGKSLKRRVCPKLDKRQLLRPGLQ